MANVGHSNKQVSKDIKETLDNPLLSCYAYTNPIRAEYLERLITFAGSPFGLKDLKVLIISNIICCALDEF